ncbi:MAG: hypothetical protein ACYTF7_05615 [Planctomycetota bacterium]
MAKPADNRCPRCRYDMSGLEDKKCPECEWPELGGRILWTDGRYRATHILAIALLCMALIIVPPQLIRSHEVLGELAAAMWIFPIVPTFVAVLGSSGVSRLSRMGSVMHKKERAIASGVLFWIAMAVAWLASYILFIAYVGIAG